MKFILFNTNFNYKLNICMYVFYFDFILTLKNIICFVQMFVYNISFISF